MLSGATVGNLELPGAPLEGYSCWYRVSRVLAVVVSLAELLWIKPSIISVRAEISACKVSGLTLILSLTEAGENLLLLSTLPSFPSASTSLATFSSCADISSCALESYRVPLPNVLNL